MRKMFAMTGLAMVVALATVFTQPHDTDFGRMFPALPAFQPDDQLLVNLALAMQDPNAASEDNPNLTPSGLHISVSSSTTI